MSAPSGTVSRAPARPSRRLALASGVAVAVLAAMALTTKVVRIGSPADVQPGVFSAAQYGQTTFPGVQAAVAERAVSAPLLAAAIGKDRAAASKQYGVDAGVGPEMAVKFTGVAGKEDSGNFEVGVEGMPPGTVIRVQTGPAIMGTDLRDATGTITFGQFTNQIDYQNAGSALNKEMKKQILAKVKGNDLAGKTIAVVGVFQLADPANWLVTPVKLDVQ